MTPGKTEYVSSRGYAHQKIDGIWKREHILIAERALGHALPPGAVVHHVNEIRADNRHSNLVICENQTYHRLLHARANRLREFGRLDVKRCVDCQHVQPLVSFHRDRQRWDGRAARCIPCNKAHAHPERIAR